MPFTLSHPAAIIPIKERWKTQFCFTGLILGSMSPDFEYFLHFRPIAVIGHTIGGFFILNLPLCLILAYVYHNIIKKPLILHMPLPISNWYSKFALSNWKLSTLRNTFVFIYSALLGMLSHIVWDSFTHANGAMVRLLPFLGRKITIFVYPIAIFKLLQHGSSCLGAIILLIYFYKIRYTGVSKNNISARIKLFYISLVTILGILLTFSVININSGQLIRNDLGVFVVTIINCTFLGISIASLISRIWINTNRN